MEGDIRDAGVVVDMQHPPPVLPAVVRLVEPALAAGGPEWAFRGNVDDVAIARIDEDPADVF
jgi:hypothetical protein